MDYKIEIPMMNYQISKDVLGWTPVLYGGVPHWRVDQGENLPCYYIPLKRTPNFKEDFEEIETFLLPLIHKKKFEVFLSIRKEQTLCLLVSMNERYDATSSDAPLAISLASLQMVGITVSDLEEKWVEMYPAS